MLRNKLLFSIITNYKQHPIVYCPAIDDQHVIRKGDDGLFDCAEIIMEQEREKYAGCGWPIQLSYAPCGCDVDKNYTEPCHACWPHIIIQNGLKEEYCIMQINPTHYKGLM